MVCYVGRTERKIVLVILSEKIFEVVADMVVDMVVDMELESLETDGNRQK